MGLEFQFHIFSRLQSRSSGAVGWFLGVGMGRWRLGGVGRLPSSEVDSGAIFPGGEVCEGVAFGDDGGPGPAETAVSGSYHCN